MKKVFFVSVLFFIIEICLFVNIRDHIFQYIAKVDPIYRTHLFDHQNSVDRIIHQIVKNNEEKKKAIYIFGGSTARELFAPNEILSADRGYNYYNCGVASQQLIDTIRLVDNINTPESTIVYVLSPPKFTIMPVKQLVMSKYFMGLSLKYPLASKAAEDIIESEIKKRNIEVNSFVEHKDRIIYKLNVFVYLLRLNLKAKLMHFKGVITGKEEMSKLFWDDSKPYHHKPDLRRKSDSPEKAKDFINNNIRKYVDGQETENLELNISLLNELLNLANKKKIRVILFDLPISDVVWEKYEVETLKERILFNIESRYPNVHYYQFNYSKFKNNQRYFSDAFHLNDEGRKKFNIYISKGLDIVEQFHH